MKTFRRWLLVVVSCMAGASSAQDAENLAELRAKEAESLARLTAEGQSLYDDDRRAWGRICADSWRLADEGHLREAVRMASKALFLGVTGRNSVAQAYAKRDLGLIYSYAGLLERAEEYSRQAIQHAERINKRDEVVMVAHKVVGDVLLRRGKVAEAIRSYESALKSSSGDWKLFVRISMASAHTASKAFSKARAIYDDLGSPSSFSSRRHLVQRGRGNLALAEGNAAEALQRFTDALSAASGSDADYERAWALDGIGRSHLALENKADALKAYLQAVDAAERVRARFRNEEFKSGLFGDLRQLFDQATLLLAENGKADKAWEVSERGRARALLDMVRNRVALGSGAAAFVETQSTLPSAAALRAGIPNDTALVQYHVLPDRVYGWVLRKDATTLVKIDTSREAIARTIERFRSAVLGRRPGAAELGAGLYRTLIAPLRLKPGEGLVIIPHDALHYLPFQALRNGDAFLIEQHPISYAPSAATLNSLLARPLMSTAPTMLALGNPELGDAALALPGAEREVERLRAFFPSAAVFIGRGATKSRVIESAPKSRLVHIAAHAEIDPVDPLFSRIRLAGAAKASGDLEAREVYKLDLSQCSMVVLSACDSGLGRVSNGDEIWGFTRAFLGAGTGSLIVSLWPVADESTERLMTHFYSEAIKTGDRREALQRAQLELLKEAKTREPFFWAPFTLVGDWR